MRHARRPTRTTWDETKNNVYHGKFFTDKKLGALVAQVQKLGYDCTAPSWPAHNGEPSQLRADIPPGTGELSLTNLVDHFSALAELTGEKPILIGHSLGGLVAQILVSRGLASGAVCISSVAPNAMLSVDWGFFRNSTQIANPLKGDKPFEITEEGFHQNFGNMMSEAESATAYERSAVHESRNVLRGAMGKAGHIDLDQPHVPFLFIAGENDEIIPDKLNKKNADHYSDKDSVTDCKEFPSRGHFICGQPGWEEVADYAAD